MKLNLQNSYIKLLIVGIIAVFLFFVVSLGIISHFATKDYGDITLPEWIPNFFGKRWFWILVVIIIAILFLKPWKWLRKGKVSTPPTQSIFSTKKFLGNSVNIAGGAFMWGIVIVIVLFVGLLLCEVVGSFMSKQVDKDDSAVPASEQILQYGDYHFIAGEKHTYYHSDAPEFFRPTHYGDSIHVILRSKKRPTLYHEFTVVRNDDGGFSPKKRKTIHNTLDNKYEYYTVEAVGRDTDITYSDHPAQ
jgi:hypothetical protein